ncbi:MAG: hypothetical protein EXS38_07950 [Opitutus sp.]|nr:hypothetical protein [Opitutus sp.]
MKNLTLCLATIVLCLPGAFAGSATLYYDSEANPAAQGSGSVNFNSYNASSITISVAASAYGGSQLGGGRNYRGHAEAVIGSSIDQRTIDPGSDPMSIQASNSLTVTKGGDGNWYNGATNLGASVSVSSSAYVDGENAVGNAGAYCTISWVDAPANRAPTISWNTTPGTVASGQGYTISAHAHDADGNLTQVNVWKNSLPFAFAGGGNGFDGDSGNPTSDTGPQTVTFTAQAADSNGAISATISQTVTVTAPNHPPTASISGSTALQVGQFGSWSFSAADVDGNLAKWRFYASTNANPQWSAASGSAAGPGSYSASFASAGTYTWVVDAQDAMGATGSASITVSVTAPVDHAPTITWNTAPGTVASGQGYTISAHGHDQDGNLAQVNVWKNGVPFAFAGGGNGTDNDSGNPTSDSGPTTVTFTAQAVDANGATSATISQTVTVNAPNHPPTASISGSTSLQVGQVGSWSFSAADGDGNLAQWRFYAATNPNPQWSAASGSAAGPGSYSASFASAGTYTWIVDAQDTEGATGSASITVSVTAPANHAPTISWNTTPGTVASGVSYTVSAHGHDQDGNLTQVKVWKNGSPFAFGGGGNGSDADSGNATSDTGPQTITFTAQSVDAAGATSATISQSVTVSSPPPTQYTLATSAGAGGSVSPGGTFTAGSVVTVSATPDSMHDFAGWSGDATGAANPVGIMLDRNRSVQANFTLKNIVLATSATSGGTVTPGGSYPAGSTVTISASPDATHLFTGWTGDASGTAGSVAIYLDRAKSVQAVFTGKTAQTISFTAPGNQPVGASPVALNATASSGLPVTFIVVSGPATLTNGTVQMTGPGAVTIQATQPGDGFYLPASPVTQTFNVIAPVSLKYRGSAGTQLNHAQTPNSAPLVIQVP